MNARSALFLLFLCKAVGGFHGDAIYGAILPPPSVPAASLRGMGAGGGGADEHLLRTVVQGGAAGFSEKDYWNGFHGRDRQALPFEWYASWDRVGPLAMAKMPPSPQISVLVPGCGDSSLCLDMARSGYGKVLGLDYSPVAILRCKSLYAPLPPNLEFAESDVTGTGLGEGSFHLVMDKATLDALTADDGKEASARAAAMLTEMCRLLSPDAGCLIIVSLLQSCVLRAILSHFSAQPSWLIELQMLPPVPEDSHPPFLVTCSRLNGASSSKLCVTGGGGGVETWLEGDEGGVDAALVSVGFAVEMLRMGREMAGGVQRGVVCVVDVMRGEDAGEEGLETEVKRRAEGGEGRWRVKGVERIEIGFGISKLRCTIWGNGDEGDLLELLEGDGEEGGLVGSAHLHSVSAMLES